MHVIVSTMTVVDGTTNQCTDEFRCRILHLWLSTKSKLTMHGGWKDQWKNVSQVQKEIVRGTWPASCWYAYHIFPPSYMEKMSLKATKMTSSVLQQGRRREGEKKNKLWCIQTLPLDCCGVDCALGCHCGKLKSFLFGFWSNAHQPISYICPNASADVHFRYRYIMYVESLFLEVPTHLSETI